MDLRKRLAGVRTGFTNRLAGIRRVLGKDDVRALARRYFVANGFDGTLTSTGVVVGAVLAGQDSGFAVIAIGLGAAVGLGTSGIWSVWEIERAETSREREKIESAMLTTLADTRYSRDLRNEQIVLSLSAATGPVLGILITLIPFLFEGTLLSMTQAAVLSVALGVCLLGSIGAYMGHISKQRWYIAAIRMGLAGIVVAGLTVLLPG